MKKIFTLLLSSVTFIVSHSQIAAWNVYGQTSYGVQGYAPTTLNSNLTSVGLTRGSGVTTVNTAGSNLWGGNGFAWTTAQAAIDSSKFITFSITTSPNYYLSLTDFDSLRIRLSSTGPINILVQYSMDATNFTNLKSYSLTKPTSTTSFALDTISLSGRSDFQGITPNTTITFRVVPFGASSTSGTFYFGNQQNVNHITINGSVVAPLNLKSFAGSLFKNNLLLNWSTFNEVNVSGFEIEKSVDGIAFQKLGFVSATNKASATYSFSDVVNETSYYRLKMVDKDGSFTYSKVITINPKKQSTPKLDIFPNPVASNLTVSHEKAAANAAIKVVTVDGKVVLTRNLQAGATQSTIDVSKLIKGNYLVVFTNDGATSSTQFVKQ